MNQQLKQRLSPLKGKWSKVAELAGVSPMTVYRIMWGEPRDHKMTTYQRISSAIDVVEISERTASHFSNRSNHKEVK